MEKNGDFIIRIQDFRNKRKISPENYDIKELELVLKLIEDILYPETKDRPIISYNIQEGSVKHLFRTGIQAIIAISAVFAEIESKTSIDFLDIKTARAIESLQNLSYEKEYKLEISTSLKSNPILEISPNTNYIRSDDVLVDSEFYFYGTLTDAGGKKKANIHLDVSNLGVLAIAIDKDQLIKEKENLLYKKYGVRAKGKQNIATGEIEKKSLSFIEFVDYSPKYDEKYLTSLIQKAKKNWKDINVDTWLDDIRGEYE